MMVASPNDSLEGYKGEYNCYEYEAAQEELSVVAVDHGEGEDSYVRLTAVCVSAGEGLERR